jgi:hypothetical protein
MINFNLGMNDNNQNENLINFNHSPQIELSNIVNLEVSRNNFNNDDNDNELNIFLNEFKQQLEKLVLNELRKIDFDPLQNSENAIDDPIERRSFQNKFRSFCDNIGKDLCTKSLALITIIGSMYMILYMINHS